MTISTVFIVRHALRHDSIEKSWAHSSPTPYDTPLAAPQGFDQARKTGDAIASLLYSDSQSRSIAIHTSPFLRCVQTASCIAASLSAASQQQQQPALRLDAFLGEWQTPDYYSDIIPPPSDGHASLQASSLAWLANSREPPAARIDYAWPLVRCGRAGDYGEAWATMHARVTTGLGQLLALYNTDPALGGVDTLVLVTHGAACNPLIGDLLRAPVLSVVGLASYCGLSTSNLLPKKRSSASKWTVVSADGDTETESESSSLDEESECDEPEEHDARQRRPSFVQQPPQPSSSSNHKWKVVAASLDLANLFMSWNSTAKPTPSFPPGEKSPSLAGHMSSTPNPNVINNTNNTWGSALSKPSPQHSSASSASSSSTHLTRFYSNESSSHAKPNEEECTSSSNPLTGVSPRRDSLALLEKPPGLSTSNSTSCSSFDLYREHDEEEQVMGAANKGDGEKSTISTIPRIPTEAELSMFPVYGGNHSDSTVNSKKAAATTGSLTPTSHIVHAGGDSDDDEHVQVVPTAPIGALMMAPPPGQNYNYSYRSSTDSDRTADFGDYSRVGVDEDDEAPFFHRHGARDGVYGVAPAVTVKKPAVQQQQQQQQQQLAKESVASSRHESFESGAEDAAKKGRKSRNSALVLNFGKMAMSSSSLSSSSSSSSSDKSTETVSEDNGTRLFMLRPTFPTLLKKKAKKKKASGSKKTEEECEPAAEVIRKAHANGSHEDDEETDYGLYRFGSNQRLASY